VASGKMPTFINVCKLRNLGKRKEEITKSVWLLPKILVQLKIGQKQSCLNVKTSFLFAEKWVGPNSGITSFDNIGLAMLTVFQVNFPLTLYNQR
jgi:hypothetical protein